MDAAIQPDDGPQRNGFGLSNAGLHLLPEAGAQRTL